MFWDIYYFIFYNYTYLQSILISLIDYHAFQSTIFLRIQKNKKKSAMVHFDWPITKKILIQPLLLPLKRTCFNTILQWIHKIILCLYLHYFTGHKIDLQNFRVTWNISPKPYTVHAQHWLSPFPLFLPQLIPLLQSTPYL
jgi:hypothetical protein